MVKPASGVFIQPVADGVVPGAARTPQWQRVYRAVAAAIDRRALPPGARLPSARQLARDWRVARGAVDEAFGQLQIEGLIERRVGAGTFVAATAASADAAAMPRQPAPLAQRVLASHPTLHCRSVRAECIAAMPRAPLLHPMGTDIDGFPLALWRRLVLGAHAGAQRAALAESPSAGLRVLREAIAQHLAQQRGLPCTAAQVLVLASPGEGLNLLARVLLRQGDTVWLEDPTHPSLPWLLRTLSVRVAGVPVDGQGFDVAAAVRRGDGDAALVYLHPLGQYPLGQVTSVARGDELLAWARSSGAWIVEATINDELWPRQTQPPMLARRDPERVIVLGTFEGVMFPSLRVAYVVLPPALVGPVGMAQELWGPRVAAATQLALAEFIDRGHMHRHLRQLRERLARRREWLRSDLLDRLPAEVGATPLTPAPHCCLHWGAEVADADLVRQLRARGVVAEPLSSMAWPGPGRNGLVLGYADRPEAELRAGLAHVARSLQAAFPPRRRVTLVAA